jgi:hypothetical protein
VGRDRRLKSTERNRRLFKLSKDGVGYFLREYGLALGKGTISVKPWEAATGSELKPKKSVINIGDCLIGEFLEYLCMRYEESRRTKESNADDVRLRFNLREVSGGWHEIDHWGDYLAAIDRIESNGPDRLELS